MFQTSSSACVFLTLVVFLDSGIFLLSGFTSSFSAEVPFSHGIHTVAPFLPSVWWPFSHGVHFVAPSLEETEFTGHSSHDDSPLSSLNVPALHFRQASPTLTPPVLGP